jgi:hypothetical protein
VPDNEIKPWPKPTKLTYWEKAALVNNIRIIQVAVSNMVLIYDCNQDINDIVKLGNAIPMSLDEWALALANQAQDIDNMETEEKLDEDRNEQHDP